MATTSQPRSLLSIAKLNMAKSRARPSIWSFVRIDQTCLGRSGGFAPVSLPLFHGTRLGAAVGLTGSCLAILLGSVTEGEKHVSRIKRWKPFGFRAKADSACEPAANPL